jgi:hypothetical protein
MKIIFKAINKFVRGVLNILVRVILGIVYFILFFPLGMFLRVCTDFLNMKKGPASWTPRPKIGDVREFLSHQ